MKKILFFLLLLFTSPAYAERQTLESEAIQAEIEILEYEMHVYFSPTVQEKIVANHWDSLAWVSVRDANQVPHRAAYLLRSEEGFYILKAAYPRQSLWTLRLILGPKKGQGLDGEWTFLDRNLVNKE